MCGKGMAGVYGAMGCRERPLKLRSHMLPGLALGSWSNVAVYFYYYTPKATVYMPHSSGKVQQSVFRTGGGRAGVYLAGPPPFAYWSEATGEYGALSSHHPDSALVCINKCTAYRWLPHVWQGHGRGVQGDGLS